MLEIYGINEHDYFGIVYLSCRGCRALKTYWVYYKHGDKNNSFYAKHNNNDTFDLTPSQFISNKEAYLENIIPAKRRIPVEK